MVDPPASQRKRLTPNQWLAFGTWGLVIMTFLAFLDNRFANERAQRAYVFVEPYAAFNIHAADSGALQPYVAVDNSGKSFATIDQRWFGVSIKEGGLPRLFGDLGAMTKEPGEYVSWPNQPHLMFRTIQPNEDQFKKWDPAVGHGRIYVFGKIIYHDIFGDLHQTIFCHMYFGGETQVLSDGHIGYGKQQAIYCDRYNEAT